jgi:hypothetical protein
MEASWAASRLCPRPSGEAVERERVGLRLPPSQVSGSPRTHLREDHTLHLFCEPTWGFVVHPSGKRMAFRQGLRNVEVWVLEKFLPAHKAAKQ